MCLNEYTLLEIWKKEKVDCSKRPSEKKNGLEQKQKKKKWRKKNTGAIWALFCVKLVELMIFEKKKLCSTSL